MDQQVVDRRADTRVGFGATRVHATLRPGCNVRVVDLSQAGALVEGERPLRPGARVHVQVMIRARTLVVMARILRCAVWQLHPSDGAIYRGALHFENRCEAIWESSTRDGADVPGSSASNDGPQGHVIPVARRTMTTKTEGAGNDAGFAR